MVIQVLIRLTLYIDQVSDTSIINQPLNDLSDEIVMQCSVIYSYFRFTIQAIIRQHGEESEKSNLRFSIANTVSTKII